MAEALLSLLLMTSLSSTKKIIADLSMQTTDSKPGESIYTVNFNETFKYGLLIINRFGLDAAPSYSDPVIFLPSGDTVRRIRMQRLCIDSMSGNTSGRYSYIEPDNSVGFSTSSNSLTFIACDPVRSSYHIDYCIMLF